ncbi:MAG: CHAD domain-containing protein [Nostoc sp. DedVER02]|uniref:CHAD domain-containing protein n=1 Tax=unclassified Nostoc TaxID=2593658 RepID=UPI002AD2E31B|nr:MULTISPECIES: CHAD domain-containing protein [unclassified Nostoc]MDZ7985706.1 CHAD domain-containing protein [Nostoc sp. DedVER02]MDZ8111363.1 CHAD domain-containing protein [Nostoc sp. DedVER01b]
MKLATQPTVKTLGDYAYQAIQKHVKKTWKWEKSVKKDEDPEALHQMRVGMRRLRTAVTRFELALDVPKPISDKNIGKIARRLGNLRDLDVLKESLENNYQPKLPCKEQESLRTAFTALAKQREDVLSSVQKTLKDESYKSLKDSLDKWLDKPIYKPLASITIQRVLPDLLLPEVSNFLLHPGWLIGTQVVESEIKVKHNWEPKKIEQQLTKEGEILHSLRKEAKRIRYQMELFTDLYGESYASYMTEVKNIQEILGTMQDSAVLTDWLTNVFKSEIKTELPTLATLLTENRYQSWQQWQPLQERYLKSETRHSFHLTMLHPLSGVIN